MFSTVNNDNQTERLFKAIDDENWEAFQVAIGEGANVNAFDQQGYSPLMKVAMNYSSLVTVNERSLTLEKQVIYLITNSLTDINLKSQVPVPERMPSLNDYSRVVFLDEENNTALHLACILASEHMVSILLRRKDIDLSIENYERKTAEECSDRSNFTRIKKEFEKAKLGQRLLSLMANGNFNQEVRRLSGDGNLNPNCFDKAGLKHLLF